MKFQINIQILSLILLFCCKFSKSQNTSVARIGRSLKGIDWCKLNCKNEKHIGCLHKNCLKPDKACTLVKIDADVVVDTHNELREKFAKGADERQPDAKAANMMLVNWDADLAYLAACNLKNCPSTLAHDHCHVTEKFDQSGQNLAWSSGKGDCTVQTVDMIHQWYEEIKNIPPSVMKEIASKWRSTDKVIGHFTALVWSTTTHIGCAMINKGKECTFCCNYGPAGNMVDGQMYKEGPAASQCPEGIAPNKKLTGLCGEREKITSVYNDSCQLHIFLVAVILNLFVVFVVNF